MVVVPPDEPELEDPEELDELELEELELEEELEDPELEPEFTALPDPVEELPELELAELPELEPEDPELEELVLEDPLGAGAVTVVELVVVLEVSRAGPLEAEPLCSAVFDCCVPPV